MRWRASRVCDPGVVGRLSRGSQRIAHMLEHVIRDHQVERGFVGDRVEHRVVLGGDGSRPGPRLVTVCVPAAILKHIQPRSETAAEVERVLPPVEGADALLKRRQVERGVGPLQGEHLDELRVRPGRALQPIAGGVVVVELRLRRKRMEEGDAARLAADQREPESVCDLAGAVRPDAQRSQASRGADGARAQVAQQRANNPRCLPGRQQMLSPVCFVIAISFCSSWIKAGSGEREWAQSRVLVPKPLRNDRKSP
jgi:hypothetical protein